MSDLVRVRAKCEKLLRQMSELFTPECRLTLVMRHTTNPECFLVLSADTLLDVRAVLERVEGKS